MVAARDQLRRLYNRRKRSIEKTRPYFQNRTKAKKVSAGATNYILRLVLLQQYSATKKIFVCLFMSNVHVQMRSCSMESQS